MSKLVGPSPHAVRVHHPWRRLRERLPDWEVVYRPLPEGTWGRCNTPDRTVTLAPHQLQRERRCTLDHELIHAEAGDIGVQPPWREAQVNAESARRLIPMDALLEWVVWAADVAELADELFVDEPTLQCRLDNLTDVERQVVRAALRERDWHWHAEDWAPDSGGC